MAKRKPGKSATGAAKSPPRPRKSAAVADDPVQFSNLPLHDLFQQQMRDVLDRTDLDEEAKQAVLLAASCPCCGAAALSFTAKIKRRT